MTRKAKTNIKIASATIMCIFTLASAFTGTIAWFSSNRAVSTSNMTVAVAAGSKLKMLSCYAVRYDGTYGAIAYDVSDGNANVTMTEYDYVFKDRNVNTPLFFRMELTNFDTSKDLTVTIPCTGSYITANNNDRIDPNLSNVVSVKFLCGLKNGNVASVDNNEWSGSPATTQAVVNSYNGMHDYAALFVGQPYVVNGTKSYSITLTLPKETAFDEDFILVKQDENDEDIDVVVVYIAFDYHVTNTVNLVTDYYTSNERYTHSLSFASDISNIEVDNK